MLPGAGNCIHTQYGWLWDFRLNQNDLSAFSDADSITEKYIDEMAIAVTNGIIFGSGTTLDPQRNVTRLEFAMFLSRSIRELPVIKGDISAMFLLLLPGCQKAGQVRSVQRIREWTVWR